jgi:hypothetical protein
MPIGRRSSVTAFVLERRDGKWQEVSVERLGGIAKGAVDGARSIAVSRANQAPCGSSSTNQRDG